MLSADADDRVDPMHARKFAAILQHAQAPGGPPVYLRVEKNAGHGGADMMKSAIERVADEYAFVLANVKGPRRAMSRARRAGIGDRHALIPAAQHRPTGRGLVGGRGRKGAPRGERFRTLSPESTISTF